MSSQDNHSKSLGRSIEASDFQVPDSKSSINEPAVEYGLTEHGLNRGIITLSQSEPWWYSQFNLMLCVFGLLGVATLLFIVLTPEPKTVDQSTLISAEGDVSKGKPKGFDPNSLNDVDQNKVAPYSEAQQEQARSDSQNILSDLLNAQKSLERKHVIKWAKAPFEGALSLAATGDDYYKQQDYQAAIEQYQYAVDALDDIRDRLPAEIRHRVESGTAAVAEGKSNLARQHFQSALTLDPNHIPALQGLERVKTLDQMLALMSAAAIDEQDFLTTDQVADIQNAKAKYRQAVVLDPRAESASLGLQRATDIETDKHYRLAMSEGFNALFVGRYSAARVGFNSALQYKPEDITAVSALRQSLASDKRASLTALLRAAKAFERQEQWASALTNYQTVLQRDRNQVGARVGRIRSKTRIDLDRSLNRVLQDPLALSQAPERARAQRVLDDARSISNKGPILDQQIVNLETSLKQIDTTVKVLLSSDSLTQVSVKKVGAKRVILGRFSLKKLVLKPGRYTLIGTRLGFRDVRTDIELAYDTDNSQRSITITCDEPAVDAG